MDRISVYAGVIVILLVAMVGCAENNKPDNEFKDFFGVNLNEGHQVEKLHEMLSRGSVLYNGTKVEEWTDGVISDYDLSGGKITSMVIIEGSLSDVQHYFNALDSIYSNQFNDGEQYKQNEWIGSDKGYYTEYLKLYDYKAYRIILAIRLYSGNKDENNISHAYVRVGLGEKP